MENALYKICIKQSKALNMRMNCVSNPIRSKLCKHNTMAYLLHAVAPHFHVNVNHLNRASTTLSAVISERYA